MSAWKSAYVSGVRATRSGLDAVGLLGRLDEGARRSRTAAWARSLLAVYDLDDLVALDVPWWTYEASGKVARFLSSRSEARVLEWGSGASTVWLARRASSVTSIEHDPDWAEQMRRVLPPGVELLVVPPVPASGRGDAVRSGKKGFAGLDFRAYVEAVDGLDGGFDLVVVDGRAREACLPRALDRLVPGGLLVLDNVDRARYRRALEALGDRVEVDWTRGLTPSLPYPTRTALVRLRT